MATTITSPTTSESASPVLGGRQGDEAATGCETQADVAVQPAVKMPALIKSSCNDSSDVDSDSSQLSGYTSSMFEEDCGIRDVKRYMSPSPPAHSTEDEPSAISPASPAGNQAKKVRLSAPHLD